MRWLEQENDEKYLAKTEGFVINLKQKTFDDQAEGKARKTEKKSRNGEEKTQAKR